MRGAALLALFALGACAAPPPAPPLAPTAVAGPALAVASGQRRAVLTLAQDGGGRRLWRGAGLALGTEGARVTGTAGFGQIYTLVRSDGPDPLASPLALEGREVASRRIIDLVPEDRAPEGSRFGLVLDCRLRGTRAGAELVVEERCTGPVPAHANRFRFDAASGAPRGSEQWVGDAVPALVVAPGGG